MLRNGRAHYGARVPLGQLSAHALPLHPGSIDLVLCFEASHYLPEMQRAFDDIARTLDRGASVQFGYANPERPDFIRSPHSAYPYTADQFREELERRGFSVAVEGAFPVDPAAKRTKARLYAAAFALARRAIEALGRVPNTLRGRARLKPLVCGELRAMPGT